MRNNFDYYRQLLKTMAANPEVMTMDDAFDIASASMEQKGRLALYSLRELDDCRDALSKGRISLKYSSIIISLLHSLSMYEGFSHENFMYISDNGSLGILGYRVVNMDCPLTFLVNDEFYDCYRGSSDWRAFETALDVGRDIRLEEIVAYAKNLVSNSEHMSDEMVLSVAGIGLGKIA